MKKIQELIDEIRKDDKEVIEKLEKANKDLIDEINQYRNILILKDNTIKSMDKLYKLQLELGSNNKEDFT